MSASVAALHPAAKPRNRSIAARRAARQEKFERERLIVDSLNRGVSAAEIARRIGVTEKRMRALVKEILARRMPAAPEDFVALQVSRLNEALMVAYGAMSPGNLRAVALVVRIVRELDRYHGFAPAQARAPLPHKVGKMSGEARQMGCGMQEGDGGVWLDRSCNPASIEAAGHTPSGASRHLPQHSWGRDAPPAHRPETAPQALENMESAPEKGAAPAAPDDAVVTRDGPQRGIGAELPDESLAPPVAGRAPRAGAQMAPQVIEKIDSTPENGGNPAATAEEKPAQADGFAGGDAARRAPAPAGAIELPQETIAWPESAASVLVADPAAPGGFRRMTIRMLRNGVAAG